MKTQTQSEVKKSENPLVEARDKVIAEYSDTSFRLEWIRTVKGIDFVNDAKSSNVIMSLEAIDQCPDNVIWIARDEQLEQQFFNLKDVIDEKVKAVVYLAEKPNETLEQSCKGLVENVLRLNNLEEAVKASFSLAKEGDTVLFSPASPGYQKLETYKNRGEEFNQIVNKL